MKAPMICLLAVALFHPLWLKTGAQTERAPWPPPPPQASARTAEGTATASAVSIPKRFFTHARGYEEALALQKEIGADLFLYISHKSPPGARGLCTWWENRGMKAGNIQRLLRDYIKVELPLPSDHETRSIAERLRLWEGPTVVIIHPNGFQRSISVFDWPGGRPELKLPETLEELILENSSEQQKARLP